LGVIILAAVGMIVFKTVVPSATDSAAARQMQAALAENKPVVLLFTAHICALCREVEKLLAEIQPEFEKDVAFVMVDYNAEENGALIEEFEVDLIPRLLVLSSTGERVAMFVAPRREELVAVLEKQRRR
jgi:thiol-disulfide isomerase/thioredoxin